MLWLLHLCANAEYRCNVADMQSGEIHVLFSTGTTSRYFERTFTVVEHSSDTSEPSDARYHDVGAVDAMRSCAIAAWLDSFAEYAIGCPRRAGVRHHRG